MWAYRAVSGSLVHSHVSDAARMSEERHIVAHMDTHNGLHGAYLRRSLVAVLGRPHVDVAIARGELRRLWTGVLVDTDRYADPRTRAAAGLLMHGRRSVVCGATAAALHGFTAIEPDSVHVLVPYGTHLHTRAGLTVHTGPPLPPGEVEYLDGLPVLTVERVITDLLCAAGPRDALAVTDQALAVLSPDQAEARRERIARRLVVRADRRGVNRGIRLLGLASGRAESPPESWLRLELADLGFPRPEVNWSVRSVSGIELFRIDLAWPEQRIALEYNGYAVHAGREIEDEQRASELRRRGWIVLVVTKADLRDSRELERTLREAFASRGCHCSPGNLSRV